MCSEACETPPPHTHVSLIYNFTKYTDNKNMNINSEKCFHHEPMNFQFHMQLYYLYQDQGFLYFKYAFWNCIWILIP